MKARAVRITQPGGPEVLELGEIDVRPPGGGELLVAVAAAGLNRADCLQRRGVYPAPAGVAADVPGLEYAGVVEAVGPGVTSFAPGDRVMGIVGGGGMCTHLVVHERETLRVPDGLSLTDAAAVPEAFLTAWDAVYRQAGLRHGETLLVHAIASGIGTAALQLGQATGNVVYGTSRSADKLDRCQGLGLKHPILVEDGTFSKRVKADVILDTIGAAYLKENLKALRLRGRIVTIGLLGGATGPMPLGLLLARRATLMGSVLRSRPLEEKAALTQEFSASMLPLFAEGSLRPVVDDVLPMSAVVEAHSRMESNKTFGKLVLSW
ncbi:MAG: NADPH2:quinone reductase [Myxococcota bacterium]